MRQPKPFFWKARKAWYVQIGKKQIKLSEDESEAWAKYHKLMRGASLGDDPKVSTVLMSFQAWSEDNHRESTQQFYFCYQKSFQAFIGDMAMSELKPYHLTKWVDKIAPRRSSSPSTRNGAIRAIQRGLSWAKKQGVIGYNPLQDVEKPQPVARDTYLTPEQYQEFLDLIKDQCFRDVVETMRHTGCRPQELRSMEARWFNRTTRCWEFPDDPKLPPKLQGRTILLNDKAFEISSRLAKQNPEGPMFRNQAGECWKKGSMIDRCRRLRKKLDFYVTPYSIRHTFATEAIINGVDLITISKLMGHADLKI